MPSIPSLLPDADVLLSLEPEELAGVVLQYLALLPERDDHLLLSQVMQSQDLVPYPKDRHDEILRAVTEAWVWLEKEGLIAPRPGQRAGWVFVTRRGQQVAKPEDLKAYRQADLLPRQLLHPRVAQRVSAAFLRGDYDVAVFQAFKEVEVRVREAGGLLDSDIGVKLMRKAFKADEGRLCDSSDPPEEQEALAHLFAGAVGCYKNPHSHRAVVIDASDAVGTIILASHLLNIVDRRVSPHQTKTEQQAE